MLVENQKVEMRWCPNNKDWFINKGYIYTKMRDCFYVLAEDLMPTSKTKVDVRCDYCGEIFSKTFASYISINDCTCSKCTGIKKSKGRKISGKNNRYNNFLKYCEENNFYPLSDLKDFCDRKNKVSFICSVHGNREENYDYFIKNGCKKCKHEMCTYDNRKNDFKLFLDICKKHDYVPISQFSDYRDSSYKFIFECPHHGIKSMYIGNLRAGKRCNECRYITVAEKARMDKEILIDMIESKNNNILLNPDEYDAAITRNLKVKCGSCNNIFYISLNNYQKNKTGKCPNCNGSSSMGEYVISELLLYYNVEYTRQEHFNGRCRDINPLPFDFYLPYYNLCIEFNGKQHYEPIEFFGGQDAFEVRIKHDKMKEHFCKDNNIDYLCIPYWDFDNIEEILIEKLNVSTFVTPSSQRKKMVYKTKQKKINIRKTA